MGIVKKTQCAAFSHAWSPCFYSVRQTTVPAYLSDFWTLQNICNVGFHVKVLHCLYFLFLTRPVRGYMEYPTLICVLITVLVSAHLWHSSLTLNKVFPDYKVQLKRWVLRVSWISVHHLEGGNYPSVTNKDLMTICKTTEKQGWPKNWFWLLAEGVQSPVTC